MTQRIAPNNQLPATHFIEVFYTNYEKLIDDYPLELEEYTPYCDYNPPKTIKQVCIFRIRENKLPTKHNFNK